MTVYNVEFDIAAIVLYLIMLFFYYTRKNIHNYQHFIFGIILWAGILSSIFDLLSTYMISKGMPVGITTFVTTIYFLAQQVPMFMFMTYLMMQSEIRDITKNYKKILVILPFSIATLTIIISSFTGFAFSYSMENGYQRGYGFYILYGVPFFYAIGSVYFVIRHSELYSKVLRVAAVSGCLLGVVPYVLQHYFPQYLITGFGGGLSMLLLMFTLHDHDEYVETVTGIQNYKLFTKDIKKYYASKAEFDTMFIRIADTDLLTMTYGIEYFDALQKMVCEWLTTYCRKGNIYYINQGYYALIFANNKRIKRDIDAIQAEIYEKLNQTWKIEEVEVVFSSYILTVNSVKHAKEEEILLSYMTYLKKMRRQRYGIIPVSEVQIKDRYRENKVSLAIERGLRDNSFEVYYQPIFLVRDNKFVTAEALIRLNDSELGWVSPSEFIPIAEKHGTILEIGSFVFEEVCRFIRDNNMKALGLEYIELNVSTIQCLQRNFIDYVDKVIKKYDIDPGQICFEITETAASCSPESFTRHLKKLSEMGFLLAIDDYGTGYGNLQRMLTSPFDIIKFDKETTAFVSDEVAVEKARAFLALFQSLNKKIVCEGVETQEQYEFLKKAGTDYIQGYYFSKPVSEEEFKKFLIDNV